MTREELNQVNDALRKIDNWCKENSYPEHIVYIKTFICNRNGRRYMISCSTNGIGVRGDGRFSSWMRVDAEQDSLNETQVGIDIVLRWKSAVKPELEHQLEKYREEVQSIANFEV